MKMNTGILGCALVAGLMTFASNQAQAIAVIGNSLYSPAKLKATITYEEGDKFKKMSFSNKDLLALADEDFKGAQLALGPGDDFYVIYKDGGDYYVDANLTDWEYAYAYFDYYVYTYKESNNSETYADQGYAEFNFYDYYEGGYDELDLYGNYSDSYVYKYNNKNSDYNFAYKVKANGLNGEMYSYDGEGYYNYMPATGSVSASGNGKILD